MCHSIEMQEEQDLRLWVDETGFFGQEVRKIWQNSVLYWKKKKKKKVQYVNVCTEKGVSKNSFPLIFNKEVNREFNERWVARLAQGVQQAGNERQNFFLKITMWIL